MQGAFSAQALSLGPADAVAWEILRPAKKTAGSQDDAIRLVVLFTVRIERGVFAGWLRCGV